MEKEHVSERSSDKKKKIVLITLLVILLCLTIAVVGTYALFSDGTVVPNHLEAGKLDVTLERTKLEAYSVDDETGALVYTVTPESDPPVDFSKPTNKNIFGIKKNTVIVPGSKYVATMRITNDESKSDVDFLYWIEIVFDDSADLSLADQLKVTVTADNTTIEAFLSSGLKLGSENTPIGVLSANQSDSFTVAIEFTDNNANNLAKGQTVGFDLVVHAVQATTN